MQQATSSIRFLVALFASLLSIGCSSSSNSGGGQNSNVIVATLTADNCATYTETGGVRSGAFATEDGVTSCTYNANFVDVVKPLNATLTLSAMVDRHIFRGSLILGYSASSDAMLESLKISPGVAGAVLTIEAGANILFEDNSDFMVINRGAKIMAEGTATDPITISGIDDPDFGGTAERESSQLWGGLVINGFGVTNVCAYTGTRGQDLALNGACHTISEGVSQGQSQSYGGISEDDNSGSIAYLIVKYAGAETSEGDELNAITFNAVGSGTSVENVQVYRAYDDGIEFFGGSVNITNYVAAYVQDDSIDVDAGYNGTIENALVVQAEIDGNRCIEADGIASYDTLDDSVVAERIAQGLNSRPTIRNLTCIISANEGPNGRKGDTTAAGTHDPGQGVRLREATYLTLENALVTNAYSVTSTTLADDSVNNWNNNYCLDIDDDDTLAGANSGNLSIRSSVFVCAEAINDDGDLIGTMTEQMWFDAQSGNYSASPDPLLNPESTTDVTLQLFDGASALTPLAPASLVIPGVTNVTGITMLGHLGSSSTDWTTGWTIGLSPAEIWF